MSKWYRFLNIYSVDVAIGAVVCSFLFANVLNTDLSATTALVLGLTVWLIYTFDHLDDARHVSCPLTHRHTKHKTFFKQISIVCIVVLMVVAGCLFLLPVETVVWGASLFCIVSVYFLLLKFLGVKFSYFKEISVSIIYTAGILIGPASQYSGSFLPWHYILFFQFLLIAFSNLSLFSLFELDKDQKQRFPSLVQVIGAHNSMKLLKILIVVQLLLNGVLIYLTAPLWVVAVFTLMGMGLFTILKFQTFFGQNERYRLVGDAVFLIPVIGLLI